MMTDKELLERAAKAAGLEVVGYDNRTDYIAVQGMRENMGFCRWYWNPLAEDGEALRLSVQCGIETSIVDDEPGSNGRFSRACAGYATETDPRVRYVFEDRNGDLFAAMRRAIVRAAAAMSC